MRVWSIKKIFINNAILACQLYPEIRLFSSNANFQGVKKVLPLTLPRKKLQNNARPYKYWFFNKEVRLQEGAHKADTKVSAFSLYILKAPVVHYDLESSPKVGG